MSAIPQGQASLFQHTVDTLSPVNQAVLRCTLAHLPDDRYVAIINRLASAIPGKLRHYVYILGAHDSAKPRPKITMTDGNVQRQKANDASVLSGEELRAGLRKLPKEICDAIESAFIKSTLAPGFIFPDQAPGPNGKHSFNGEYFEPTRYEVLLGLNRANYQLHSFQFWSNFFVVDAGTEYNSLDWLDRMHEDVQAKIRNVYISPSRDDMDKKAKTGAEYKAWASHLRGAVYDPLKLMHDFDRETIRLKDTLMMTWHRKMWYLKYLELENLIIDVRDAFGLDDSFLGDDFMHLMPPFTRKPQSVKVIANDDASAASLLSIFWARNP